MQQGISVNLFQLGYLILDWHQTVAASTHACPIYSTPCPHDGYRSSPCGVEPGEACHRFARRRRAVAGGHPRRAGELPHRMPDGSCRRRVDPLVDVRKRHAAVGAAGLHHGERARHCSGTGGGG
uniref:Uncharacterized protein n=1 Tax=Arundo donax TaxID=35708 RepID=A0A0A9EZC5_ARUDO